MVTDAHLVQIGRVVINFAALEAAMAAMLWGFMGRDQIPAQAVTAQLSFEKQLTVAQAVAMRRLRDKGLYERVVNMVRKASGAEQSRNQLLHSMWMKEGATGNTLRLKIRASRSGGLEHVAEIMEPRNVEKVANDIKSAAEEAMRLVIDLSKSGESFFFPVDNSPEG